MVTQGGMWMGIPFIPSMETWTFNLDPMLHFYNYGSNWNLNWSSIEWDWEHACIVSLWGNCTCHCTSSFSHWQIVWEHYGKDPYGEIPLVFFTFPLIRSVCDCVSPSLILFHSKILWELSCCRKIIVEMWVRVGERSDSKSLSCLATGSVAKCYLNDFGWLII